MFQQIKNIMAKAQAAIEERKKQIVGLKPTTPQVPTEQLPYSSNGSSMLNVKISY